MYCKAWFNTNKLNYTCNTSFNFILVFIKLMLYHIFLICINNFCSDYMDENCGKTLNLDTYFRLQASRKSSLSSGLNCSVDIFATSKKLGGSARVHARLLSINMPFSTPVSGCDRVKLELHDGIRNKTLITRMFRERGKLFTFRLWL